MKNILFVAFDMEIGGAERALISLLDSLDTEKYNVDLFLFKQNGSFLKYLSQKINLLPENEKYAQLAIPLLQVIKNKKFDIAFGRLKGKFLSKIYKKKNRLSSPNSIGIHYSFRYTKKYLPLITEKKYDLAIGFTVPYYIVAEKTFASKKMCWLHTDYSCLDGDTREEFNVWNANDYIGSISDDVTNGFLSKFPELKHKIVKIENTHSERLISKQAEEKICDVLFTRENDEKVLVSVGRFTYAKNFDNIPEICKLIIENNVNIKWYIIGYGSDEELIRNKITEFGVKKNVIILGKKDNPYPYIKACDLYVQPSRFEGNCVSVHEAQILHKPVVITNYATSGSQLTDGFDGVVVPMDNQGCAEGIIKVLNDEELMKTLSENTKKVDYTNSKEVEKLYSIMGD